MDQPPTTIRRAHPAWGSFSGARHPATNHEPGEAIMKSRIRDFAFELVVYCSVCSLLLSCLYYLDRLTG